MIISDIFPVASVIRSAPTARFYSCRAAVFSPVSVRAAADGFQLIRGELPAVLLFALFDLIPKMDCIFGSDLLTVRFYKLGHFFGAFRGEELFP